nr:glucose-1-phosphate thymidylyltransferase RfbA [Indioceanicola profundi]
MRGGTGTRLNPVTKVVSKQLLPVYDKPLIYYSLTTLMLAGITEMLIITTPQDAHLFKALLGDGAQWGLSFSYAEQARPEGVPQALTIGRDFIGDSNVALILGDNMFFGHGLGAMLERCAQLEEGGLVFGYRVKDPQRYGVVEFAGDGRVRSIMEKPAKPRSNFAVTGLYFFDRQAPEIAAGLKPSARGETEIVDVINTNHRAGTLRVEALATGYAWLDTGTPESLIDAGQFVRAVEQRQGYKIACPERIAFQRGLITVKDLRRLAAPLAKSEYGDYLLRLADGLV